MTRQRVGTRGVALAALGLLVGCDRPQPAPGPKVIRSRSSAAIQGGTVDQSDSAVVGILINTPQGMSLCSGVLIAPNLVLTAHHCVADVGNLSCGANRFGSSYAASRFEVTTSYSAMGVIFNGGGAMPTADNVTWWAVDQVSVPGGNICGQDMAVLRLPTPITGVCPLIPRVDTNLVDGDTYQAVGFGITSPNGNTAGTRYSVSGMSVQCVADCNDPSVSQTQEWIGGSSSPKGTCEGDSGGPALDSSGRVIGTVSRGPAGACNQTVYESVYGEAAWIKQVAAAAATAGGYTAAGWVTGGATSDPANGYCPGSSSSASSSSSSASSGSTASSGSSSSSSSSSATSATGSTAGSTASSTGSTGSTAGSTSAGSTASTGTIGSTASTGSTSSSATSTAGAGSTVSTGGSTAAGSTASTGSTGSTATASSASSTSGAGSTGSASSSTGASTSASGSTGTSASATSTGSTGTSSSSSASSTTASGTTQGASSGAGATTGGASSGTTASSASSTGGATTSGSAAGTTSGSAGAGAGSTTGSSRGGTRGGGCSSAGETMTLAELLLGLALLGRQRRRGA